MPDSFRNSPATDSDERLSMSVPPNACRRSRRHLKGGVRSGARHIHKGHVQRSSPSQRPNLSALAGFVETIGEAAAVGSFTSRTTF